MKNKFPFLPDKLLTKTRKCKKPQQEYSYPPPLSNTNPPRPQETQTTTQSTNIITCNLGGCTVLNMYEYT